MKTKIYTLFIGLIAIALHNKVSAQNANTTLSNLIAPTSVNVSLVPKNKSSNLGSLNKPWKKLYLDSAVYLNGNRFLSSGSGTGLYNTAVGRGSLNANTTGFSNAAVGDYSLYNNQTGSQNVALGESALFHNSSGFQNIALGTEALYNNNGARNIAIGGASLFSNTTGYSNVALGYAALENNTTMHNVVAIGDSALFHQSATIDDAQGSTAVGSKTLYSNTTGIDNVAMGRQALYSNISANWNTAIGSLALYSNTTGGDNTALGHGALLNNTTGEENTAIGLQALVDNTTGINNTANGDGALNFNTTGANNTATGWQALRSNTSAEFNTGDGFEAGDNVTDGWYNTFIGADANCGSGGHLTNSTAIGNEATVTSSNHVVVGNSSVTSIGGYVNWSNLSDGRVKKNIKQNVPGLSFINKLRPITYNLDLDAADKIIDRPQLKDKDGKIIQPSQTQLDARKAKEQIIYTGFIAQDVEKAATSLSYDFSGVDKPGNTNTLYGLRYSDFVVPLVKAVQELSKMNNTKDSIIQIQNNKIDNLENRLTKIESMMNVSQSTVNHQQSTTISSASLQQNLPNPFSNSTTISYSIPQQFSSAKIIVTDKNGNALKQINVSDNKGSVNIDAAALSSGAYQYSLYVDGKIIASKQMILEK